MIAYENSDLSRTLASKTKLAQIKYLCELRLRGYLGNIIFTTQKLADIGCIVDDEELAELIMAIEGTKIKVEVDFVQGQLI